MVIDFYGSCYSMFVYKLRIFITHGEGSPL